MEIFCQNYLCLGEQIQPIQPIDINSKFSIYEVFRVINGVPLFLENHYLRLINSAKLINKKIPFTFKELNELIIELITINKAVIGNIKIIIGYETNKDCAISCIGFIPHKYPEKQDYEKGIKIISKIFKRENPNAKIQNEKLRSSMNQFLVEKEAYEVLLIHPEGYITECSRSNIFFIASQSVITAPESDILPGITREYVINICKENNIELKIKRPSLIELNDMDSAFITGTSPKILPINSIDSLRFNTNSKIMLFIMHSFENLIDQYLIAHQKLH